MGKRNTFIAEDTKTTVLAGLQGTGSAVEAYTQPTGGTSVNNLRAVVTMANAADLVLTLKSADDATGTNPVAFEDVPLYIDGVRQTDSEVTTITDATGNFIVDFCVDSVRIPDGKFIGIHAGVSNAANLVTTQLIENPATTPSL